MLGVKVAGAFSLFLLYACLALTLPDEMEGYGMYGLTMIIFFGAIGRIGLDRFVEREGARLHAEERPRDLYGFYLSALGWSSVVLLLITLLLMVFAEPLAVLVFSSGELSSVIYYSAPGIVGAGLSGVIAHFLLAVRRPAVGMGVLSLVGPLGSAVMLVLARPVSYEGLGLALSAGFSIGGVIGMLLWRLSFRNVSPSSFNPIRGTTCFVFWIIVVTQQLVQFSNQLIGASFLNGDELGTLTVAHRVTLLISLIVVASNAFAGSRYATAMAEGREKELEKLLIKNQSLSLLFAALLMGTMAIWPALYLLPFGGDAGSVYGLMLIMMIGQGLNVLFGPGGHLLLMRGYERDWAGASCVVGVLTVLVTLVFSSLLDVRGAALAAAAAVLLQNVSGWYLVRRKIGINLLMPWLGHRAIEGRSNASH